MTCFIDCFRGLLTHKSKCVQCAGKLCPELSEFQSDGAAARNDDHVVAEPHIRLEGAVAFPQPAADAVALHGVAELRPDGKAEAVSRPSVFKAIHRKRASGCAFAAVIQPPEFMVFF